MSQFVELNWAGAPIRAGESYAGRPELTTPETPKVLGNRAADIKIKRVDGRKISGWKARWAKLKSDPLLYAEHMAKLKAGQVRALAARRLKAMKNPREKT